MNPWVTLLANYGFEFVIEFMRLIEKKGDPTIEDFEALAVKYGTKTADQYLEEAKSKLADEAKPEVAAIPNPA